MSFSGEIIALPLMVAAAGTIYAAKATVSVLKGVGEVATFGARLVHSAVQTAVVNHLSGQVKTLTSEAFSLNDDLATNMDMATRQCYADYERTLEALEEDCRKEPDMTAFLNGCQQAHQKLLSDIREKREELETTTIGGIHRQIQTAQAEMNQQRRETEESIQRIADDMERKRQTQEFTLAQIAEASAMINDFRNTYSNCEIGRQMVSVCEETLEKAKRLLDEGLFEAAMTTAYAAKDTLLLKVSDILEAECKNRQLYSDCKANLETLKKLLQQHASVSYPFNETKNGKTIVKEIEDFSFYYRGEWEQIQQQIESCERQLSGKDFRDYIPENLQDLLTQLSEIQNHFLHETSIAYERLHCELLRKETGKLLFRRYQSLGYEILPLTEEEKKISVLDSLIMNLRHTETGEEISLRLNASSDMDGHVSMNIQMEDHTEYEGNDEEIEEARVQARTENCEVIQNSNIGKNLRLKQRCSNPDVRDKWQ